MVNVRSLAIQKNGESTTTRNGNTDFHAVGKTYGAVKEKLVELNTHFAVTFWGSAPNPRGIFQR